MGHAKTSVFIRKYGKTLKELAACYGVSTTTIWNLHQRGLPFVDRSNDLVKRNPSLNRRLSQLLRNIEYRCTNPNDRKYINYGGRGIRTFLTRDDLEALWIRDHAETMARPTIDRINNDGNYTVENCRFIELHANLARPRSGYRFRKRKHAPAGGQQGRSTEPSRGRHE